jgi:hypothetical protein
MPKQLLDAALQQVGGALAEIEQAVTLVLINEPAQARELWWNLAHKLKEPLVTLSLLPETLCRPGNGCASMIQQRKWQLEQLAMVIKDVDEVASSPDTSCLSNALEARVLPWLEKLHELIGLWQQTVLAGARANLAPAF